MTRVRPTLPATLLASLLAHVTIGLALPRRPLPPTVRLAQPDVVDVQLQPPAPRPPKPAPVEPTPTAKPPEPPPPPPPVRRHHRPRPRPQATRPAVPPAPQPPEPTAPPRSGDPEAPADPTEPARFDGLTLTNEQGSWSAVAGSGNPYDGPIGPPPRRTPRGPRRGVPDGQPEGTPHVPLADLGAPPRPPPLDGALARHYPARARSLGIEGQATLRARVRPDGRVDRIRVLSERPSDQGFGEACRRTLAGSRWKPPRARDGRAVATTVTYRCTFRIRD